MERKEYTVNELFENQVLNDIYETRGDGLECLYIRMYGEPEEIKETKALKTIQENKETEIVDYDLKVLFSIDKEEWIVLIRFSFLN